MCWRSRSFTNIKWINKTGLYFENCAHFNCWNNQEINKNTAVITAVESVVQNAKEENMYKTVKQNICETFAKIFSVLFYMEPV